MSVPAGSLPTTGSTPAAASWALGCHPLSEVTFAFCRLHGRPTGSSTAGAVLDWLIFLAVWAMYWLFPPSFPPPIYLGWRLFCLLSIPAFDRGSYRLCVPLQHPWLTFCGSYSATCLPMPCLTTPLEVALLWPLPKCNSFRSQFVLKDSLCNVHRVHHKIIALQIGKWLTLKLFDRFFIHDILLLNISTHTIPKELILS